MCSMNSEEKKLNRIFRHILDVFASPLKVRKTNATQLCSAPLNSRLNFFFAMKIKIKGI